MQSIAEKPAVPMRRANGPARKSLRVSMLDGVFSSVTIGLVESYFVPFALAIKATAAQIGYLTSAPTFIAALMQTQAQSLSQLSGGRKRALRMVVFLQALVLGGLPLLLLLPSTARFSSLLALMSLYMVFGSLASPLWGSMMSEYLPSSRRSGYFGWRSGILGFVLVGTSFGAGALLNKFGKQSLAGFAIIFSLAALCRFCSFQAIGRMTETGLADRRKLPRLRPPKKAFDARFVRYALFCGIFSGAINLVAPFFPVYLLNGLHYSYLTYTVLVVGSQAAMYYSMTQWGKQADHSGNVKMIRICAWAMPLISLMWMVRANAFYFFCVQVLSGLIWAGYNLCTTNFIYDSLPSEQRVRGTVLFNLINGFFAFVGATLGGALMEALPPLHGQRFFTLALVSTVVRVAALVFLLPGVQEVRHAQPLNSLDLFYSMIGVRPMLAFLRNGGRFTVREEN